MATLPKSVSDAIECVRHAAERLGRSATIQRIDALEYVLQTYLNQDPQPYFDGIRLTPKEKRLADLLASKPGVFFSHEKCLNAMHWDGCGKELDPKTVEVYIFKLRRKLEANNSSYGISNAWDTGYALVPVDEVKYRGKGRVKHNHKQWLARAARISEAA